MVVEPSFVPTFSFLTLPDSEKLHSTRKVNTHTDGRTDILITTPLFLPKGKKTSTTPTCTTKSITILLHFLVSNNTCKLPKISLVEVSVLLIRTRGVVGRHQTLGKGELYVNSQCGTAVTFGHYPIQNGRSWLFIIWLYLQNRSFETLCLVDQNHKQKGSSLS